MGRPLNKKFFGNFNIGTQGYTPVPNGNIGGDDGIGGEGLRSTLVYSNIGFYKNRIASVTVPAPSIPGGVQAVGTLYSKVDSVYPHAKGTGYQIGDELTDQNGNVFRVTKLRVVDVVITGQAGSQMFDGGENLVWDSTVDDNWTSPTILGNIGSTGNPNYDLTGSYATFTGGVWDGTVGGYPTLAPASLTITGGGEPGQVDFTNPGYNTRGANDVNGGVGDNNGYGGTANFTYGVEEVELISNLSFSILATTGPVTVTGSSGINVTFDVFYKPDAFTVSEKGSGYIGTEALVFLSTVAGEDLPVATFQLTIDSGTRVPGANYNVGTNQENAIIIHARTAGPSTLIGDIREQVGSRRYRVTTEAGVSVCKLVTNNDPDLNEGYIKATDANGYIYFVKKLTAHRATLIRWDDAGGSGGWLYIDNAVAGWTLGSPEAPTNLGNSRFDNGLVTIENA
jgi:hypothetical protein